MKILVVGLVLALVLISGCQTPYQMQGLGGGYSEEMLGLDGYIITYRANYKTPDTKIYGYLHKRAAELTSRIECKYYAVTADSANPHSANSISIKSTSDKIRVIKIKCYRDKPRGNIELYEVGQ
ncbi:MAG: hypothetical protein JEZ07_04075 [Phycisphaerae bacterium]|nr:hypothetical protein [Phycisphaerae bacterium]